MQTVPGHFDIVEDHEGILLIEPARDGVIEKIAAFGKRIPADEFETRGGHRNAEGDRVLVAIGWQGMRRIDRNLVGKRGERREDPRTAHDDAVLRFADLAKGHIVARLRRIALRLVDGRIDDRMRQRNVVAAQIFLIVDEVFRALLVAIYRPFLGAASEARIGHIHVVRRAAHQADRIGGDFFQPRATARQVLPRSRNHVANIDLLARLRIRHQAGVSLFILEIVDGCDATRRARECRVVGDALDLAVADPNLPRLLEALQKLCARTCRHGFLPLHSS